MTNWILPDQLIRQSVEIMRPHGRVGDEGLALWLGREDGDCLQVTHVVEPYGPGFKTSPLHMSLSLKAMATLTTMSQSLDTFLIGQIHSHPKDFLDLSYIDQMGGIRFDQYLSVVCPYYAQVPSTSLSDCGIHIFDKQRYRRLTASEAQRRIRTARGAAILLRCEVQND